MKEENEKKLDEKIVELREFHKDTDLNTLLNDFATEVREATVDAFEKDVLEKLLTSTEENHSVIVNIQRIVIVLEPSEENRKDFDQKYYALLKKYHGLS